MATVKQLSYAFGEIAPPSKSAPKKVPFEVFINHRGTDTKHTLASSIYDILQGMGVQVFLDKEVFELGDNIPFEIEEAMRTSLLHIAILSPNYAQSPWCLAELSFMLKTGSTVIPVFYNVDPSDARYLKRSFAVAFDEHESKKRYTPEKLKDWKEALHNVSFHSGEILQGNDDEKRLLKSIVNSVMKHMRKAVKLEVAKHPVGLDETIHDFERSALDFSQKVQIVGIVGMGGSGKTTLATEIYNRKSSSINKCSCIFEVRDAAYKNDLHNKQKKLMQDIGFSALQFDNVQEGKAILKNRLRSFQVLIILDDVDHAEQLDALLPEIHNFEPGSLIIVTSRELGVLKSWGVSSIYQMKGLNPKHARELLCWHAFLQSSPPNEFQSLVEEFVKICNRLPLSLKIFGGLLYGKPKDYWDSQLNKASRLLPNDIKESLKISFDALDEEEQEIFLDIASFFIGEEKSMAIAVWDGSRWNGEHSWEVLENKCLVEVDKSNRIKMHDQLRDLGKDIAKGRSPYRVWSTQQIIDMQNQSTERVPIRGIKAATDDFYEESHYGTPFEECMELVRGSTRRFKRLAPSILVVKENYFTEELATISPGLVWLRWIMFSQRALPLWLSLKNLRVLELPDAEHIEELWSDSADLPLELRELNLVDAPSFLRFPRSIRCLKHLKKISLTGNMYDSIDRLPEGFYLLQSLEHIQLRACVKLTSLPSNFGLLTNLRHLDLSYCRELRMLPESFKQLIHLQYINFYCCKQLTLTSENNFILENMIMLETLIFSGCTKLQELPLHITNQLSLRHLYVEGTRLREIPSNIGRLSKLEVLKIGSELLTSLPPSIGNLSSLSRLEILYCEELETLPESIGNLASLTWIKIFSCKKLKSLPESVGRLSSLINLIIYHCGELESLPESIGDLSSLTKLEVYYSKNLNFLPESIGQLSSLTSLCLCNCGKLENLPESIRNLSHLTNIQISECKKIKSLPESIGFLSSLTSLNISQSEELEALPESIGNLSRLSNIQIKECKILRYLPESVGQLSSLTNLDILKCEELETLPESIGKLFRLTNLKILLLKKLRFLPESIGLLPSLTNLSISKCEKLESLPESIGNLSCLIHLEILFCKKLKSLPQSIGHLSSLTDLKIYLCEKLESLPKSIWNLSSLTHLSICLCKKLGSLPEPVGSLYQLEELSIKSTLEKYLPKKSEQLGKLQSLIIESCPITELAFLSGPFSSSFCNLKSIHLIYTSLSRISISQQCCPSLETLNLLCNNKLVEIETLPISIKAIKLSKCKMLKGIGVICDMANLETLSIQNSGDKLEELPSFADLFSLKEFEIIETAVQLKQIEGLENCRSLERLRVLTCCSVPVIKNLEQLERLQRLELSAECNISAIEPCLQTIKKWPYECVICARTEHAVESVVNSFAFPGLTLVDSCMEEIGSNKYRSMLRLRCRQRRSSSTAVMVCFAINSSSANTFLTLEKKNRLRINDSSNMKMEFGEMKEGKWVFLAVFTQPSDWLMAEEYQLIKECRGFRAESSSVDDKVRGMLVMGEQDNVVEGFKKLLLYFGDVNGEHS
ncbi:hypothetical protein SUGI_0673810 [Cryptomeria japonica]|uniref:disease resistance protein RPV1 n=1 Tax=Cryptomeria japonica TaxID=3369 RepID=UPI002414A1A6|nr:disease resistance protein RPV1 [Cryptomeria japonica]GLJ33496.1 hypothetical protein SUGI_0673810 [Cryptomeria japonica]